MGVTVRNGALSEGSWDDLFNFLDPVRREKHGPDRDTEAAAKYRQITRKLECFFASRGCDEPEDLAMETALRVAAKCGNLTGIDHRDCSGYFYGVARNVLHEWLRAARRDSNGREKLMKDPALLADRLARAHAEDDTGQRCLERCLASLTQRARAMILAYYRAENAARAECHRSLANEFGKSVNALRIEVHRVRKALRGCVWQCVHPESAVMSALPRLARERH